MVDEPMSEAGATDVAPPLRLTGIVKDFAGTRALDGASLAVQRGEVHALVGGNGSGKSTLIKILAGVHHAEPGGTIEVDGQSARADTFTPEQAHAWGLRFVHQDAELFADLDVAENLAFGRGFETGLGGHIEWREVRRRAAEVLERFDIQATPRTLVRDLPPTQRTMVAVARAFQDIPRDGHGVLVLDEPTASLPAAEVELLLSALRNFATHRGTILYASHRLDEVLALCNRVTVLRDGRDVATVEATSLDERSLIELIAGRALDAVFPEAHAAPDGEPVVTLADVHSGPLRGIDLTVHRGEVLGIAGLIGAGHTELLRAMFGDLPIRQGRVLLDGKPLRLSHPDDAMAAGIAYVPEDRATASAFLELDVRTNLSAANMGRYWRGYRWDHRLEQRDATAQIAAFKVRTASDRSLMGTLSGGNQQKVVLARWLAREPRVLLLDEPTQGVDVGARAEIYDHIRAAVDGGAAALVASSDLEELVGLCDRVVVLAGGRIAAEMRDGNFDSHQLTDLIYRSTKETP